MRSVIFFTRTARKRCWDTLSRPPSSSRVSEQLNPLQVSPLRVSITQVLLADFLTNVPQQRSSVNQHQRYGLLFIAADGLQEFPVVGQPSDI